MLEPEQLRQLELDIEVALLNYGYSKQITNIVNALRDFIRDNNSPIYPEYIQEVEDFIMHDEVIENEPEPEPVKSRRSNKK